MRSIIALCLCSLAAARWTPGFRAASDSFLRSHAKDPSDGPQAQFFTQRLDHFNYQEDRTWQQRFYVNDTFYSPGGPVFFQIGGEGAISGAYVTRLAYVNYAARSNALVVALEHRFYGASQPTGDLSLDSLRFLNSRQALADAAYFIKTYLNGSAYSDHGDIISFGGSYPGALSAWFRMKYPHVVKGAVASSAPVHAVLDMVSYLTDVDNALLQIMGPVCLAGYREAFAQASQYARADRGAALLSSMFNTCSPVITVSGDSVPHDTAQFFQTLIGVTMGTVQYNRERPSVPTVTDLCGPMTNSSMAPLDRLVQQWVMFGGADGECMDISYADTIAQLRNATVDSTGGVGIRQWTYQTCTEFGYFQSTDAPASQQPFGDLVPLQLSIDMCVDGFAPGNWTIASHKGHLSASRSNASKVRLVASSAKLASAPTSPMTPRIVETNVLYGSIHPIGATRILYVNGGIDPWHTLSVLSNLTDTLRAYVIPGAAHCANMDPYVAGVSVPAVLPAQEWVYQQVLAFLNGQPL